MGNFFKSLFSSSQAEEAPEKISRNDKKNFDIFKYDGIRAQQMGRLPYAIKCFTEALNIQDDFETMNYLVIAYTNSHEFEEALEVVNRMVSLEPGNITPYLTRTNILLLMKKGEEAIADCLKALELEENNPLAWFLLGKAKRIANDLAGAIEGLTKALSIKDDFTDAYLLRSEILFETNQPGEALPDVEKAIELAPDEESAYLLRGQIHDKLNDFSAAADDYNRVLELNPFNTDAFMFLGALLISAGNPDDAIQCFNEAIELKPDFANAYSERAKAKALKGDREGAAADIKTAGELHPEGELPVAQSNFEDMYKGGIY
ncbi:MAG: tetratricopeptide repeat protein [Tannerellaceae bacterium]|jgi:tetratricopeptide (TPR) repeat protein|nr:tetratricopeptide repeat protein [Tannerellaceae bacterium]